MNLQGFGKFSVGKAEGGKQGKMASYMEQEIREGLREKFVEGEYRGFENTVENGSERFRHVASINYKRLCSKTCWKLRRSLEG